MDLHLLDRSFELNSNCISYQILMTLLSDGCCGQYQSVVLNPYLGLSSWLRPTVVVNSSHSRTGATPESSAVILLVVPDSAVEFRSFRVTIQERTV